MSDADTELSRLREQADALRRTAAEADNHLTWRRCRDLADCLDALVWTADAAAERAQHLTPRQIVAQALLL